MKREPYDVNDVVNFGKHKGKTIRDIIDRDPDYLAWALDEIDGFSLTTRAERELDAELYQ